MTICLVRHGETDWNRIGRLQGHEDIPLNETGRDQARRSALYLKKFNWDTIIASPLIRAKLTAQIIAREVGLDTVFEDTAFMERDYGKASGLTMDERNLLYPDGSYDGMEPWDHLARRVYDAVLKLAEEGPSANIIIVSHGGSINALLAMLSNREIGTGKTRLRNACLNLITYSQGQFEIQYCNKVAEEL